AIDPQRVAATVPARVDPDVTTVHGRILDATSGTPLPGVVASMHTYPVGGRTPEPQWHDPEPVTSAADGTVVVRFVPSRHREGEVLFDATGFAEGSSSFGPLRNGVDVDLGDVRLQPGTPLRLRLLCNGEPLGGVEVWTHSGLDGENPGGHGVSSAD